MDARVLRQMRDQIRERVTKAHSVERRRPKIPDQKVEIRIELVKYLLNRIDLTSNLRRVRTVPFESGQLQAQSGDVLSQFVMNLTLDAKAFLLVSSDCSAQ